MNKELEYIEEMANSAYLKDCAEGEEYKLIADRATELKEEIRSMLLADNYEDFDRLIETMELKHRIELEAVYKKGIRHGVYVQKLL